MYVGDLGQNRQISIIFVHGSMLAGVVVRSDPRVRMCPFEVEPGAP